MNDICIHCKFAAITEIRRDELFGSGEDSLIIENVPMLKCNHCGMIYLEPNVSRMIDEFCAHPGQYFSVKEKFVANYCFGVEQ